MYWNSSDSSSNLIALKRLTLTWDVLKFVSNCCLAITEFRLTLTWDVLKWVSSLSQ